MYGGEHICRAESRTNVRNSFSAGGPASRDVHVFYVRSTHNVRGRAHLPRREQDKCEKQFFRRRAGES